MKNKEDDIQELFSFVGEKTYVSTGYFETARGKEYQITYHRLADKGENLWARLKWCWRILTQKR